MNKEEFLKAISELNIDINDNKMFLLEKYANFLKEYNKHTNLTAINDIEDIYLKHFYDSLTIVKAIDLNNINNILDIGSGAGFPGVVLKIIYPHLNITLVDSNGKKTKFLSELVKLLELDNVTIINDRVENLYHEYINHFDLVTSRAVANMSVISELSIPFVKKNSYFIAMKGKNSEEVTAANNIINKMNCHVDKIIEFKLFNNEFDRTLIKVIKNEDSVLTNLRTYEQIIKEKNKLQKRNK